MLMAADVVGALLVPTLAARLLDKGTAAMSFHAMTVTALQMIAASLDMSVFDFRQLGTASMVTRTMSDVVNIQVAITDVIMMMLPVPFIYLFARKVLIWGYHKPIIGPFCRFCIVKGEKGGRALEAKAGRGLVAALLLFVGIPLPGTGAWTGTLAASILDMKFKDVLIACMGGVLLAGIIMGLASAGLLGALSGLFAV